MNRKHVSKVGKYIGMACLLFVCAMVQSCRDEYFYDDKEPDFLGASIYDYLKEQGNFTLFLRVIDDLGETEMLSKTGSKTLFVADDDAFRAAFPKLGVTKYEELSRAQKRMILYNAMLDNAYLLEMLSKWPSTDAFAEPTSGRCLRLATSSNVTDTIAYFYDKDLPQFNTAWDAFREGGIRLALDATATTMVFFTGDYLYQSNISNADLGFIVNGGTPVSSSDIYVFDKKVLLDKSNVTCKNGYVHQLNGLLVAPSNMAEEIRTNGSTNVFSHMLDRFAVPVPLNENSTVAQTYNRIYHPNEEGEQLYEKRYYTEGSDRGTAKEDGGFLSYENVDKEQQEAEEGGALYYDPGWNAYQAGTSGTPKEQDMAAIFAPDDEALLYYFTEGQGVDFIKKYAKISDPSTLDLATLTGAIDSIPVNVLADIVRLHMQISFKSSVPSKFDNLLDDARDSLGVTKQAVKKSLLANNGIVYVVNEVYSPARYKAVTGPIKLHDSLYIANWAIEAYDYDKYLLSMKNQFGVVAPFDTAMIFYDPKTANGEEFRWAYRFMRQSDNTVTIEKWNAYNPSTGEYGPLRSKSDNVTDDNQKQTLFKEMLEYYIVPEDMRDVNDSIAGRKYYRTKGYGTIKVGRDENGEIAALAGGKECQEGRMIPLAEKPVKKDNGMVYYLNAGMIHPATQSVSDVLSKTPEFEKFDDLCRPADMSDFFKFLQSYIKKTENREVKVEQFDIFNANNNVRMFDTYHYTVYVPTNEAIDLAHSQGLPTWAELKSEYGVVTALERDSLPKLANDSMKAVALKEEIAMRKKGLKTGTDLILNFVKYHFQDNSVFVDNVPHVYKVQGDEPEYEVIYETSSLNAVTNKFSPVLVMTEENPATGQKTIAIRGNFLSEGSNKDFSDEDVNVCYVDNATDTEEHRLYNVMTRDIDYNGGNFVYTSSYAVVHQIVAGDDEGLGFLVNDVIYDAENNKFRR